MFKLNKIIGQIFKLGAKKAVWKKVTELKTGVKIAVENGGVLDWDEIISIKKVGRERVYDIEVEGTHNFVGNGIIAHNTYINEVVAKIKAGIGSFRQVETSLISPIANTDLIVDLQPDNSQAATQLVIKGENDEIVTSFDAEGNATISGTLYADKIESSRLSEIEELLKEVESNQALLTEASLWNTDTATASGQFTDLFVTGQTAMTSLFVSDNFTTKNINSLTEPLSIQSLASAPLEIMAGKIIIDTNGNTKFLGNVEIAGDLKINNIIVANNIDPIATESGSIIEGEINTNATAGKAVLTANTEKIRINNNKVSLNTLIYITPITSTQNKVLYVKAKDEDYFEVGFSEALDTDVEFNWWIIELEPVTVEELR